MIENQLIYFKKACIIDIKIGKRVISKKASEEKKKEEKEKHPLQEETGYRVCGLKYYDNEKEEFIKLTKRDCVMKNKIDLNNLIIFFFKHKGNKEIYLILKELKEFKKNFEKKSKFNLIGSSVLIIFEGIILKLY
jgi:hypothetical protein